MLVPYDAKIILLTAIDPDSVLFATLVIRSHLCQVTMFTARKQRCVMCMYVTTVVHHAPPPFNT